MNILYLAHRIPYPPNKGDKLRSFRQLDRLSRRHNVWCACFIDDPHDEKHVSGLRERCEGVAAVRFRRRRALVRGFAGLVRGRTLTESYYHNRQMTDLLRQWTEAVRFDAVVAFSSSMAPYARIRPARRVLDLCDRDSQKWLDYARYSSPAAAALYRLEGRRLARLEESLLAEFDATILITSAEAQVLLQTPHATRLHIVGNGVDVPTASAASSCASAAESGHEHHRTGDRTGSAVVGFIGAMDYRPNVDGVVWFAENCWPAIRGRCPHAQFRIAGRSPAAAVRRLNRVPGVEVIGEVADASAAVRAFDISVAPLRIARGLQNKVLEAMAHAKPVVLTSGAAAGISAIPGKNVLVADSAAEFIDQVCRLLTEPATRLRLGQAGRAYVLAHHCWDTELDRFESIVTGGSPATPRAKGWHSGREGSVAALAS